MLRRTLLVIALLIVCLAVGALPAHDGAAAQQGVYVVDTTAPDPTGTMNGCDFPSLVIDCSLVGAINKANAHGNTILGPDDIYFNIAPGGIKTITPTAALPNITDAAVIDATGQGPGSDICGVDIKPCIVIDGSGLSVHANNVSIRGLAIWNVTDGEAIEVASGTNTKIAGNFLGTPDGQTRASEDYGVVVADSASHVTIGGTATADRNVISGSSEGVLALGDFVTIEGNYIGTTSDGNGALANGDGVDDRGQNVTIGGTDAGAGNLISGNRNGGSGVGILFHESGDSTLVEGNLIGLNAAGTSAISNDTGINVQPSGPVTIGGTSSGARNVISGNGQGVFIISAGTTVAGNYIGTNAAGDGSVPNVQYGVKLESAFNAVIGGTDAAARNVISGNGGPGIFMGGQGSGAPGATVEGNYIGTNAGGTAGLGNSGPGVLLQGVDVDSAVDGNTIANNVISGNTGGGIAIQNPPTGSQIDNNTFYGNYIGLDNSGQSPVFNGGTTVLISTNGLNGVIKGNAFTAGPDSDDPNVIAGPGLVKLDGASVSETTFDGALMGINAADNAKIPGTDSRFTITNGANHNRVVNNTIVGGVGGSAEGGFGVYISAGSSFNFVSGNYIGTNAAHQSGLGLAADGVVIEDSASNVIGDTAIPLSGPGPNGNTLWNTLGRGVELFGATSIHNMISANSIYNTGDVGIAIFQGNNEISAPHLTAAVSSGSNTEITGSIHETVGGPFLLEFFASPECGYIQGRDYLGRMYVGGSTTDATIDVTLPIVTGGQVITATLTDDGYNTSNFSNCMTVSGTTPTPSASPTGVPSHTPTATPGSTIKGDANCNRHVDVDDVLAALSEAAGVDPGAACPSLANVDCDADVDAFDALRILDYVAQTPLPQGTECPPIGA